MPNLGEFGTGTTNNRIINVSEDMCGEIGEVRLLANLQLKGGDGGVKEEAKKGRGQAFTLEHAINDVKGFKELLTSRHVQGVGLMTPKWT